MVRRQFFDVPTTELDTADAGIVPFGTTYAYLGHWSGAIRSGVRAAKANVTGYYGPRSARHKVALLSVTLSYGGGAIMFWLHAIYRGEEGPPIANVWHWLIDSSLGFFALTPVLFLLLPLAQALTARWQRQAVVVGALFAAVTTPGPILHDRVAGAGTPLARLATSVFGADPHVVAAHIHVVEHSGFSEALLQLAVGIPVYIVLTFMVTAAFAHLDRHTAPTTFTEPSLRELALSQAA